MKGGGEGSGGEWRGEEGRGEGVEGTGLEGRGGKEGDMGSGLGEWVGIRGRAGCDGSGILDDPFSCISQ